MGQVRLISRVLCLLRRKARGVSVATAAILLIPACARAQRNAGITGTATVSGQVRTNEGVAVKNAMVHLETQEGERVAGGPATSAGQFFFSSIPKGEYVLVVAAEGFETSREAVNLRDAANQYNASVNLIPLKSTAPAAPPLLTDSKAPLKARRDYEKAERAIASRKYGEAGKRLQAAVDEYPCYARAQAKLGLVMSQQRDYPPAEAAFRKSISCDPGYPDAYLELGQLLNAEKRFDEALPVLEQGLRQAPGHWPFYYEAGVAQYGLKHYDLAEEQFGKAKALTPEPSAELHAKLADVYLKENSFQKAYDSMQDYLKADPGGSLAPRIKTIMKQMESSGVLQAHAPAFADKN
jgi:tetratricopeptide (TPR) repeat protein